MNREWSELNKIVQTQIKKKDTYKMGIDALLGLRSQLMQTLVSFKEELYREDFNQQAPGQGRTDDARWNHR